MGATVEVVNDAVSPNVIDTCVHSYSVGGGAVLAIQQAKLLVGQLLLLGNDILR